MPDKPPHQAAAWDAAQPDPRKPVAHIHLRVSPRRKSAYVRAARPGKLDAWATRSLDAAAGYEEGE